LFFGGCLGGVRPPPPHHSNKDDVQTIKTTGRRYRIRKVEAGMVDCELIKAV
jgi:hypothetical protein